MKVRLKVQAFLSNTRYWLYKHPETSQDQPKAPAFRQNRLKPPFIFLKTQLKLDKIYFQKHVPICHVPPVRPSIVPELKSAYMSMKISTVSCDQKMKFSIKDFFNKYNQIRKTLRIWSHLLK